MRIALVHELLTMNGGAENVLAVLADMYPDAPIYTLLYDESRMGKRFSKERVRTSIVQPSFRFPFCFSHHRLLPRFPRAVEAWDFSEFDVVISSSSAFAHGIITNGKPKHLSYIHAPARYLWDRTHDVQARAAQGMLGQLKRMYLSRTFHTLREWDSEAAARADVLLAASRHVQRRIELYWRRECDVVYPPVDDVWFASNVSAKTSAAPFLLVSTLAHYKRIGLAIEACNRLKVPLQIAGKGSAYRSLKSIAGPTITFLGEVPRDQLKDLYASARATIFPGDEDFGLVPVESMACGTPVIAYRGGGALETIVEGETGMFFNKATPDALADGLMRMKTMTFDGEACRKQAEKFRKSRFVTAIEQVVATMT
jgi:glycosyltransferase involved in cell wall biosynthesis